MSNMGHAWRWVFACVALPLAVCAQDVLSPEQAAERRNEYVVVEGVVSQATLRPNGMLYLNFGGEFPNHVFAARVLHGDSLPDATSLKGKRVRVSGKVELAGNRPQVFLNSPNRITILSESGSERETQTKASPRESAAPADSASSQTSDSGFASKTGLLTGLKPGRIFKFEAPLNEEEIKATGIGVKTATVAVIVPENFDPRRPWPFFAVFVSDDGNGLNVARLPMYADVVVKNGYVGIAADGSTKPNRTIVGYDWATLNAGMRVLEAEWPGSYSWPLMMGGNSGGAKKASISAAVWAKKGRVVSGLFLAGCNQQFLTSVAREQKAPSAVKKTPVFISNGTQDTIATPMMVNRVEHSLKAEGYKTVRRETYKGGHNLNQDEFEKALRWFVDVQSAR